MDSVMQVPFKPIDFLSRDVSVEKRHDGTILLQSNHRLKARLVVSRPARPIDVVNGISFGHTATQFCALPHT